MNAVRLVLLVGLLLISSCRSEDPQTNRLLGAWRLVGTKSVGETDWKNNAPNFVQGVVFLEYSVLSDQKSTPLPGGWCNKAERYVAKEGKITFTFGPPTCIPFIDPQTPAEATIVHLSGPSLVLEWGNKLLKFDRADQ